MALNSPKINKLFQPCFFIKWRRCVTVPLVRWRC